MCQTGECGCGHHPHHHPRMMGHPHGGFGFHPHHGQHPHHHGGEHPHGGGCCTPGHGFHHFPTKEETITQLEEYLKQLQAEAKGIAEYIENMKKDKTE